MKDKHSKSRTFSGFLDEGTSFDGDLHFEGTLRVDGSLSGSVATPDVLIVGSSALVRADVKAGSLQIHGRVLGDVSCTGRIEICPGGHLQGNVRTPSLIIEEGGTFEGQSHTMEARSGTEAPAPALSRPSGGSSVPEEGPGDEPHAIVRENRTRWRILGKQLESLRKATPPAEGD
jgi:cytoskeletal protein CcmA (bactofilin family)